MFRMCPEMILKIKFLIVCCEEHVSLKMDILVAAGSLAWEGEAAGVSETNMHVDEERRRGRFSCFYF